MAANDDLPDFLSAVHPRHKLPHRAVLLVGGIVAIVVAIADSRFAIGFSSFAILVYYAIANAAAWTLQKEQRLWPRWTAGLGFGACLLVALSLPIPSVISGAILFFVGSAWYLLYCQRKIR